MRVTYRLTLDVTYEIPEHNDGPGLRAELRSNLMDVPNVLWRANQLASDTAAHVVMIDPTLTELE